METVCHVHRDRLEAALSCGWLRDLCGLSAGFDCYVHLCGARGHLETGNRHAVLDMASCALLSGLNFYVVALLAFLVALAQCVNE